MSLVKFFNILPLYSPFALFTSYMAFLVSEVTFPRVVLITLPPITQHLLHDSPEMVPFLLKKV